LLEFIYLAEFNFLKGKIITYFGRFAFTQPSEYRLSSVGSIEKVVDMTPEYVRMIEPFDTF
jgi:hypothetical protein